MRDCLPSELGISAAGPDRLTARLHIAPPSQIPPRIDQAARLWERAQQGNPALEGAALNLADPSTGPSPRYFGTLPRVRFRVGGRAETTQGDHQ